MDAIFIYVTHISFCHYLNYGDKTGVQTDKF